MALYRGLRNVLAAAALATAPATAVQAQTYTPETVIRSEQFTRATQVHAATIAGTIGTNAVVGGLSTAFRARSNGGSFWKGFAYGALGGALTGSAKAAVGYDPALAWPARITNAIGSSIADNVAHNVSPLERFAMGVGPFQLELEKGKPKLYLEAVSAIGAAYFAARGCTFDANRSLRTGSLVFTSRRNCFPEFDAQGLAFGNTIAMRELLAKRRDFYTIGQGCRQETSYEIEELGFGSTEGHELVHAFQAEHAYVIPLLGSRVDDANRRAREHGIDLGTVPGTFFALVSLVAPHQLRPHEVEATMLAHSRTNVRREYSVRHLLPDAVFPDCPAVPAP